MSTNRPSAISEAIRLSKAGQADKSCQVLRAFLRDQPGHEDALLWLAKLSNNVYEAKAAAEIALALEPDNEQSKKAVLAVQSRINQAESPAPPIDVMRVTGMTFAQARAVIWPFRNLDRPIGVLLDEEKIGLTDLGYAAEKAYDAQVRKAAQTLLLSRLLGDQLREPPPPLIVMEGAGFSAFQERRALRFEWLLTGVALMSFVLAALLWLTNSLMQFGVPSWQQSYGNLAWIIALALLGVAYWASTVSERFTSSGRNYRAGREGESRVVDALRASLPSPWTLVHNMEWPDRKWGDVDLVLLGPGGIWVIEVKAYTTLTRNSGERWEYKGRWGWRNLSNHPGQQARRNAVTVKDYLGQHGATLSWVQPLVIWAADDASLIVDDPAVPIWRLSELSSRLDELWRATRFSDEQIRQCSTILSSALEKAKLKADKDL